MRWDDIILFICKGRYQHAEQTQIGSGFWRANKQMTTEISFVFLIWRVNIIMHQPVLLDAFIYMLSVYDEFPINGRHNDEKVMEINKEISKE